MIDKTKITLSDIELGLVCDKEWILTKHIIIEKVYLLFGALALLMQEYIFQKKELLPAAATAGSPKISRGENYRGLPYVMLDYPRYFTKDSTLAIRTLFWWGNFFSINLLLSGIYKEKARGALLENFTALQQKGYWLCIHADPWQHHFEEDNYVSLENYIAADFAAMLDREAFVKIAKRISLQQWDAVPEFLENHFYEMIMLLKINFQGDGTDLSPGTPITGFDL